MCWRSHSLEECVEFMKQSAQEWIAFLRSKGVCFGCLEKGDLSRSCRARLKCKICKKMPNPILRLESYLYYKTNSNIDRTFCTLWLVKNPYVLSRYKTEKACFTVFRHVTVTCHASCGLHLPITPFGHGPITMCSTGLPSWWTLNNSYTFMRCVRTSWILLHSVRSEEPKASTIQPGLSWLIIFRLVL